jgi:chemotaxis protein MotB
MTIRAHRPGRLLAVLALVGLSTGCASQDALRMALDERDATIRTLRNERAGLKEQLNFVSMERDGLQGEVADLRHQLSQRQAPPPVQVDEAAAERMFPDLEEKGIEVTRRGDNVVLNIPASVTFASGKASLSNQGQDALAAVARRLKRDFPAESRFHVEGHTDSDPIRKSAFRSNRDLSLARALAVYEFLVSEQGIPDQRFVVEGHGPFSPRVAPERTGDDKAKNRRVEIVVRSR